MIEAAPSLDAGSSGTSAALPVPFGTRVRVRLGAPIERRSDEDAIALLERVRSEIVSTGLFEHHEPAGRMSSPHNVIQVRIGDRLVRAQAKGAAASDEPWRDP